MPKVPITNMLTMGFVATSGYSEQVAKATNRLSKQLNQVLGQARFVAQDN